MASSTKRSLVTYHCLAEPTFSLTGPFHRFMRCYPEIEIEKRFRQSDAVGRYKDAELGTYSQETFERLKQEDRLIITSGGKYRSKFICTKFKASL